MDLAGKLDLEERHTVMDGFFAILAEGVHRFEGTVNQYTGDGAHRFSSMTRRGD